MNLPCPKGCVGVVVQTSTTSRQPDGPSAQPGHGRAVSRGEAPDGRSMEPAEVGDSSVFLSKGIPPSQCGEAVSGDPGMGRNSRGRGPGDRVFSGGPKFPVLGQRLAVASPGALKSPPPEQQHARLCARCADVAFPGLVIWHDEPCHALTYAQSVSRIYFALELREDVGPPKDGRKLPRRHHCHVIVTTTNVRGSALFRLGTSSSRDRDESSSVEQVSKRHANMRQGIGAKS